MVRFDNNGIYCIPGKFYIDPWRPVDKAVITHAHSDHSRWGMKSYLAHEHAVPVMRYRLGADINVQSVKYHEPVFINGVRITFHPAGHIWGSAQVRLEYKGEIWVVSGDYKLRADGISEPFESVRCHKFITESTFGLPVYHFPPVQQVHDDISAWWQQNREEGKNSVLLAYPLGKSQRLLANADPSIGPIFTHGAVENVNQIYQRTVGPLPFATRITQDIPKADIKGALIIAPPSAAGTPWLRKLQPFSLGVCSGWMMLRGTRRRRGADRGFVLSDHADWEELNTAVRATGAESVYVTHGYKSIYSKWLHDAYGLQATEVETLYTGEEAEEPEAQASEDSEPSQTVPDEGIQ